MCGGRITRSDDLGDYSEADGWADMMEESGVCTVYIRLWVRRYDSDTQRTSGT